MSWQICQLQSPPEEFHSRAHPGRREIWLHEWPVEASARSVAQHVNGSLILGSTQDLATVNLAGLKAQHFSWHRRQSGGGAVLLKPKAQVWIDVTIPIHDSLWEDDIAESSLWLGEVWQHTLRLLGHSCQVYRGPFKSGCWGTLACYASLAPGEIFSSGRKHVGISQRRTRQGARFQTCLACHLDVSEFVALFNLSEAERQDLAQHLNTSVKPLALSAELVIAKFLDTIAQV